jgi:hypothetical protein
VCTDNVVCAPADGWVPPERCDAAKELSERFKVETIVLVESEETVEQMWKHWPFDDNNENE